MEVSYTLEELDNPGLTIHASKTARLISEKIKNFGNSPSDIIAVAYLFLSLGLVFRCQELKIFSAVLKKIFIISTLHSSHNFYVMLPRPTRSGTLCRRHALRVRFAHRQIGSVGKITSSCYFASTSFTDAPYEDLRISARIYASIILALCLIFA